MANNVIQHKRTATTGRTPNTTSSSNSQYITAGEFALNMADGILYSSDGTNLIIVGSNTTKLSVSTTFSVNSTQANISGVPLSANGSNGTAGWVLTSNGNSGSPYWAVSGGSSGWIGGTMANTVAFTNTAVSTNNISGAVVVTGGLGVNGNIYTAGRMGFANSANVGVAYTYYNQTTLSLDTVFG